jgi:hypothetical protein
MALPLIAAGVAARAVAKKLATRAAGGITGKGAKNVNPVYKNMDKQVTPLSKSVKINSNPNKTPAKGKRNPTQTKLDREERMDPVYDKYGYPSKKTVKINSNPMRGK